MAEQEPGCLVLRLAGPLQSWGLSGQYNARTTADRPTKSGVVGLLAAAQGRRRGDDISDLVGLEFGVRVDQPGSVMHDYHTVSTLDGGPLLSAKVSGKGVQATTSPKKFTHLTRRSYLQDAVFVAVLGGEQGLVAALAEAVQRPRFALALGRRSCVPTSPILLPGPDGRADQLWNGDVDAALNRVPWQAAAHARRNVGPTVTLAASLDVLGAQGDELVADVPVNFAPRERAFRTREVRHRWVSLPTGVESAEPSAHSGQRTAHDPFSLLGW